MIRCLDGFGARYENDRRMTGLAPVKPGDVWSGTKEQADDINARLGGGAVEYFEPTAEDVAATVAAAVLEVISFCKNSDR